MPNDTAAASHGEERYQADGSGSPGQVRPRLVQPRFNVGVAQVCPTIRQQPLTARRGTRQTVVAARVR